MDKAQEIIDDIETTLGKLIEIGSALKFAHANSSCVQEVEALTKLQESLLARLIDRESIMQRDPKKKMLESIKQETLHQKIAEYGKAHAERTRKKTAQKRASLRSASSKSKG